MDISVQLLGMLWSSVKLAVKPDGMTVLKRWRKPRVLSSVIIRQGRITGWVRHTYEQTLVSNKYRIPKPLDKPTTT